MADRLRRVAVRWLHSCGIDVRRWPPLTAGASDLVHVISYLAVDLVVDIGANVGQFVREVRRAGWKGPVLSIEPGSGAYDELARAAAADPSWRVAPRMSIGDRNGEVTLRCFNRTDMNTLIDPPTILLSAFPRLTATGSETVPIATLETALAGETAQRMFLKIDVQGAEESVLAGIGSLWPRIVAVQIEQPLSALIDGGAWRRFIDHGFVPALIRPLTYNRRLGRQLEVDLVLVREAEREVIDEPQQ